MENKINDKIKKHFRNREITPNPNLWNALETKLELEQTKQKSNWYKKLAYASMFIGFLFGMYLFLNTKDAKNINKRITVTPVKKVKSTQIKQNQVKEVIVKKSVKVKVKNYPARVKSYRKKSSLKLTSVIAKNTSSKTATQGVITEKASLKTQIVDVAKIDSVKEKNNQTSLVVNTPKKIKKKRNPISDKELNSLLAIAVSQENAKDTANNILRIKKQQVLYSVENEINKPLSNKVIKTLLAGARTVDNYISNN